VGNTSVSSRDSNALRLPAAHRSGARISYLSARLPGIRLEGSPYMSLCDSVIPATQFRSPSSRYFLPFITSSTLTVSGVTLGYYDRKYVDRLR